MDTPALPFGTRHGAGASPFSASVKLEEHRDRRAGIAPVRARDPRRAVKCRRNHGQVRQEFAGTALRARGSGRCAALRGCGRWAELPRTRTMNVDEEMLKVEKLRVLDRSDGVLTAFVPPALVDMPAGHYVNRPAAVIRAAQRFEADMHAALERCGPQSSIGECLGAARAGADGRRRFSDTPAPPAPPPAPRSTHRRCSDRSGSGSPAAVRTGCSG